MVESWSPSSLFIIKLVKPFKYINVTLLYTSWLKITKYTKDTKNTNSTKSTTSDNGTKSLKEQGNGIGSFQVGTSYHLFSNTIERYSVLKKLYLRGYALSFFSYFEKLNIFSFAIFR